jgi:NAD-dependent dihydropyrimidine dehydrogenase PreA subunit
MNNAFKRWWSKATAQEKADMAHLAGTSVGSLTQVVGAYRTAGAVSAGPVLARRIEIASAKVMRKGLPALRREDLCQACGKCEFAKAARAAQKAK